MFEVNTKNTIWRRYDIFIDNFEHISHHFSSVSVVEFEF